MGGHYRNLYPFRNLKLYTIFRQRDTIKPVEILWNKAPGAFSPPARATLGVVFIVSRASTGDLSHRPAGRPPLRGSLAAVILWPLTTIACTTPTGFS